MLLCLHRPQQEPFINDEQDGIGILGLNLLVGAISAGHVELKEHKENLYNIEAYFSYNCPFNVI